jgi:hypothetical protein
MFLSCAFSVLSFLLYMLFLIKTNRRNYLLSKIPSLKKYFLLHNLPEVFGLDKSELFKKFQNFDSKLGYVVHVTFHPLDCGFVFVADHEIAKILSNSQPNRTTSFIYEYLSGWIGANGGFLGSGTQKKNKLKLLRHGMSPKFHQIYLKRATFHFEEAVEGLKEKEIKQILFSSWISNVILDISFGKKFASSKLIQQYLFYFKRHHDGL